MPHPPADLVATKLTVPRPRPGAVARPGVVAKLAAAVDAARIALVSAPAGYGKSSVVAEWAHARGEGVGWLALDADDRDLGRFARYLVAAFRAATGDEQLADATLTMLQSDRPQVVGGLLAPLVNALSVGEAEPGQVRRAAVVVLDDVHLADSPAVAEALRFLAERLPEHAGLVLVTRSDPPLPLGRLRLTGALAELRAVDLRFDAEASRALLEHAAERALAPDDAERLRARTEGWPAGLLAAGLALRRSPDPSAFIASFTGSHRFVLDFLGEDVLDRLPPEDRTFLVRTAILDRMCGPLAEALEAAPPGTGQDVLRHLARANLFVAPIDDTGGWYRYHALFGELLRHRLRRDEPSAVPALHARAAAWFEGAGLLDDAARHALASGNAEHATALVARLADALLARGEAATLESLLAALPEAAVRADAGLCLARARALLASTSIALAEQWVSAAEAADAAGDARGAILALRARFAAAQGDVAGSADLADAALAALAPDDPRRADVALSLGVARHMHGDIAPAIAALSDAARMAGAMGRDALRVQAIALAAEARLIQGRARTAEALLDDIAVDADEGSAATGRALLTRARAHLARGRSEAGQAAAERVVALGRHVGAVVLVTGGQLALASVAAGEGRAEDAFQALAEVERAADAYGAPQLKASLADFRVRIGLALGDVAAASRWARAAERARRGPAWRAQPAHAREAADLLLARTYLAEERPAGAQAVLEGLVPAAWALGHGAVAIEALVLLAVAHHAQGHERAAVAAIDEALAAAGPEDHIGAFLASGPTMPVLLRLAIRADAQAAHARRILERLADRPAPPTAHAALAALAEPLTEREAEVLALMGRGLANAEIARDLVISVATVKRHVTNIHGKLGVRSRARAVAAARALGLIA